MYSSGRWIAEAAQSLNGQVEDREKLVAAIRRAIETTPDPRGPIKLDAWGNPTENDYPPRDDQGAPTPAPPPAPPPPAASSCRPPRPNPPPRPPRAARDAPP